MDSKINTGTLGVSGVSLAMGLFHANTLSSLTKDVEEIKKSMVPETKADGPNNVSLFGDQEEEKKVDPKSTPLQQIDATVGELETSISALSKLPNAIKNIETSVKKGETKLSNLATKISTTTESIQSLIDVSPKVQSGILQLKSFSKNAHVNDGGQFQAEDCNIGFMGNNGDKSALHFMGLSNDKWAMYMAGPSGKGPSKSSSDGTPSMGEKPPSHAGVTGDALRVRVGGIAGEGVIVENSDRKSLFSVGNDKRMTADVTVIGDIDENTVGIACVKKLTQERFAVSQDKNGLTRANSIAGQQLQLCSGGVPKVWLDDLGAMGIKNPSGVSNTFFNSKGGNVIVTKPRSFTRFRTGTSTSDELRVGDLGTTVVNNLSINGVNLMNTISAIETRLNTMDGQTASSTGGQTTTSSATIIATPEPYDEQPAIIKNNSKIVLKNVVSEKYIWAQSNGHIKLNAEARHKINTDVQFIIETQDRTANVSNNNRVLLKSVRHGKYLTHETGYKLRATGTSKLSTDAHFKVSNLPRTSPIRDGDTIVFMTIGGNNHIKIIPDSVIDGWSSYIKWDTSEFTTNGGGRDGRFSQFIVEIVE